MTELGIVERDGVYVTSTSQGLSPEQIELAAQMENARAQVLPRAALVAVKVQPGYEHLLALRVEEAFGRRLVGTVTGQGVVLALAESEEDAWDLGKSLRRLRDLPQENEE